MQQAEAMFGGADFQRLPHLRGVTLLLVAGVQYLLVRARTIRIFGALDLQSDAGWEALETAVAGLARQILAGPTLPADTSPKDKA